MSDEDFEPTPAANRRMTDPDAQYDWSRNPFQAKITKPTRTDPRYTIYVPFDGTLFSLGHSLAGDENDGIVGRTMSHIHWAVIGSGPYGDAPTVVSLGEPAMLEMDSYESWFNKLERTGFSVVTEGQVTLDASEEASFFSRGWGITMRASDGRIRMSAKQAFTISGDTFHVRAPPADAPVHNNDDVEIEEVEGIYLRSGKSWLKMSDGYFEAWNGTCSIKMTGDTIVLQCAKLICPVPLTQSAASTPGNTL
jgi:hypothetical protein